MKKLNGKVAIVTGAASGIGKAIALLYAAEGARVLVSDVDENGGKEVVDEILSNEGSAKFMLTDVSSPEENEALVAMAMAEYGALHIAVNNAGIGGPAGPVGEYPLDGWRKVIDINLSGVFYGMHYQIPAMLASGGGSIVNMASILGHTATPNAPAYVAAKHGVIGLTKAAALEYSAQGIRINAIGPGYIITPLLTNNLSEAAMEALVGLHPIGRLGNPEEVANLALWLNSYEASFVTGAYYPVDGGYLAK